MKLHERLVAEVRALLSHSPAAAVPTIDELATRFDVSYKTMWLAVRQLAREGELVCRRGRRIVRAREAVPAGVPRLGESASLLSASVTRGIEEGRFRVGEPLPKFDYFESSLRVSRATLARTFRDLQQQNLVHKRGKRWVVGPAPGLRRAVGAPSWGWSADAVAQPPVIVLVLSNEFDWVVTFNDTFLGAFIQALRTEVARCGIQLCMIFKQRPAASMSLVPWGIDDARATVRRISGRYLGAISLDSRPAMPDFAEWAQVLSCQGSRPLVFFDSTDLHADFSRSALGFGPWYRRLHLDEQGAIRCAMQALLDAGHRTIGFPSLGAGGEPWTLRRVAKAEQVLASLSTDAHLIHAEHAEPLWVQAVEGAPPTRAMVLAQRLSQLGQRLGGADAATTGVAASRRTLIERTPSMALLLSKGITALVSLNDWMAYQHYLWCKVAGIDIPKNLSLISFDNLPETEVLPISTVDFGFAQLGYQAAHILINDIPVKSDRYGNVPGRCSLINRGSVARPGDAARAQAAMAVR